LNPGLRRANPLSSLIGGVRERLVNLKVRPSRDKEYRALKVRQLKKQGSEKAKRRGIL